MLGSKVVMRSWWASSAYFVAALFIGACSTGLLLTALASAYVTTVNNLTLAGLLLGGPGLVGTAVARRIAVRVDGDDVLVVNPFRTYRFGRRDLRSVELGRNNYVVGGGRPVPMLELHVRGREAPIQVVASVRVSERARETAKQALRDTRRTRASAAKPDAG